MARKTKSPDERPKADIANKVITPKQKYFVPEYGMSVEAESAAEAGKLAKKQADSADEDGDA